MLDHIRKKIEQPAEAHPKSSQSPRTIGKMGDHTCHWPNPQNLAVTSLAITLDNVEEN